MNTNVAYQTNNAECNPLYLSMFNRFCQNGTIAEQMLAQAETYESIVKKHAQTERHMTTANSLPKKQTVKHVARRKNGKHKIFSLAHTATASMILLVVGTVLFSGVAIRNMRTPAAKEPVAPVELLELETEELPFAADYLIATDIETDCGDLL